MLQRRAAREMQKSHQLNTVLQSAQEEVSRKKLKPKSRLKLLRVPKISRKLQPRKSQLEPLERRLTKLRLRQLVPLAEIPNQGSSARKKAKSTF